MARIDAARGAVELSIVYTGPDAALMPQVATRLHALVPGKKSEPISLSSGGDRAIVFDFWPQDGGDLEGLEVTVRISTEVGTPTQRGARAESLAATDALVFVADARSESLQANEHAVTRLFADLASRADPERDLPMVVQLECERDADDKADHLSQVGLGDLPRVSASSRTGAGLLEALNAAIDRASGALLRTQEMRASGLLRAMRERKSARRLENLDQAICALGAKLDSVTQTLGTVVDTLSGLKADGEARERDVRLLRRNADEQGQSTRKLVHRSIEALKAELRDTAGKVDEQNSAHAVQLDLLRTLAHEIQAHPEALRTATAKLVDAQREGSEAVHLSLSHTIDVLDQRLGDSVATLRRELSQIFEGVEEVRSETRQKRRGFWRSAGA